jgi:hypothetical protein
VKRSAWERFWYPEIPLLRLAGFRIAVAWLCLYDAFLYDPTHLVENADRVETTWHPIVAFDLLGLTPPSIATTASLAVLYQGTALAVLLGFRTRTCCLLLALLAFWQGGLFYSLTKVRHDRVALCFATFALAFAPSGAALSIDAWRRRRAGQPAPDATLAAWPIVLTQVTMVIGYSAAGLTKLLHSGWTNGYTLQGIVLGHRGAYAEVAAVDVTLCQLLSVVTIAAELLAPICVFLPHASFVFVPALVAFHWGTWATMDTGPYLTLWYLWVAFVPLDRVRTWVRSTSATRPALAGAGVVWAIVVLAVVATVLVRVVPWPMLGVALLLHGLVVRLERSR